MKIFYVSFASIGAIVLSISIFITSIMLDRDRKSIETTGVVIGYEYTYSGSKHKSHLVIEFIDLNLNTVKFTNSSGKSQKHTKEEIGDLVTVRFNPNNAEDAYIPRSDPWIVLFALGYFLGGIFFLIGVIPPVIIGYSRLKKYLTK